MSLVIVGAHAMDAELMAGPLALIAADAGWPVTILHLTLGERGHPDRRPAEFGSQLRAELAAAARQLGVAAAWSGEPAPLDEERVLPWLRGRLEELQPSLLVTHWSGSWHPSHRAAHRAAARAVADVAAGCAVAWAENCEDLEGFVPSHVLPVAPVLERWLRAVRCYELFRRSEPTSGFDAPIPYWAFYTSILRVHGLHWDVGQAQALMSSGELPEGLGFRPLGPRPARGAA